MAVNKSKGVKYVYSFEKGKAEGDATMRYLLGGKGANLAEMCNLGLPVPSGVTITTKACTEYRKLDDADKKSFIDRLAKRAFKTLKAMNKLPYMPLVSVRSGAAISMAGMMDTILNVGLTSGDFSKMFQILGARTTMDSYRRLQQMFGETVLGISPDSFSAALTSIKDHYGVTLDSELTEDGLMSLIKQYDIVYEKVTGEKFKYSYEEQLAKSIEAVFNSWDNDRAKVYRKHNGISESLGTAVNIQFMVFGNAHGFSGSGVMFTRNTTTGENKPSGEFLLDAQGEDVVAGVRTPQDLSKLGTKNKKVHKELLSLATLLEEHYNDVQDIEFTIQNGELFLLQTRHAKRTAYAELKIARDYVDCEQWDLCDLHDKVSVNSFSKVTQPKLAPTKKKPIATGMGTGGIAKGTVVTSSSEGLKLHELGAPFVLWAKETTPNDIDAMLVAEAVVTATGGHTCHAAVVARSLNLPCVVGTGETAKDVDYVTVDANSGAVYSGELKVLDGEEPEFVKYLIKYIADATGHVISGERIDGDVYTSASEKIELTPEDTTLVVDTTEFAVNLGPCDCDLLTMTGRSDEDYRNIIFSEQVENKPLNWLNDLYVAGGLPKGRIYTSKEPEQQPTVVNYALKALGFEPAAHIDEPSMLMSCKRGYVDTWTLESIMGADLLGYVSTKLKEDGKYPQEVKRVSSKHEILMEIKGE